MQNAILISTSLVCATCSPELRQLLLWAEMKSLECYTYSRQKPHKPWKIKQELALKGNTLAKYWICLCSGQQTSQILRMRRKFWCILKAKYSFTLRMVRNLFYNSRFNIESELESVYYWKDFNNCALKKCKLFSYIETFAFWRNDL